MASTIPPIPRRLRMRRRRRARWLLHLLWAAGVVLVGAMLTLYMALRSGTLEAHVRAELGRLLNAPFELSSLELSFTSGAEVKDFRLYPPGSRPQGEPGAGATTEPLFSAQSIRIVPSYLSLLRGSFEIRQVLVDSPRVRVARNAAGKWSFEGLLATPAAASSGAAGGLPELPAILIEGGEVLYQDESTFREKVEESLTEAYAHLSIDESGALRLKAELRTPHARKLELAARLTRGPNGLEILADLKARKVDLSYPVERLLGPGAADAYRKLKVRGFADLFATLKLDPREGLIPVNVVCSLQRCELSPPYCASPLRGVEGQVVASERRLELKDFRGAFGSGNVRLAASADFSGPWLMAPAFQPASTSLHLDVDSLLLDQSFIESLPPPVHAVFEEYKLQGQVGVEVRIADATHFPPRGEDIAATIRLNGSDFTYHGFPYPLKDVRGEISIHHGRISFERPIESRMGRLVARLSGPGLEIGSDGEVDLVLECEQVPLDETFRFSLPHELLEIWDDFQLHGIGEAVVQIRRIRGEHQVLPDGSAGPPLKPRVTITAFPRGVRMSYRRFPYEIRDITGKIQIDTRTGRITFDDLRGQHRGQEITGSGVVGIKAAVPGPDGTMHERTLLDLKIGAPSIAVEEELVAALSENSRQLVRDFNFQGQLKIDVGIRTSERVDADVVVDVDVLKGSVRHRDFPYHFDLASGHLRLLGEETITFREVRTVDGARPAFSASGEMTAQGQQRTLSFRFDVKGLRFDDKVLDALPPPLVSFVSSMSLGGSFDGVVQGVHSFNTADPSRFSLRYEGQEIVAQDASVDFGLRIHEMVARGGFVGSKEPDSPHRLRGEVFVDSAWFNRLHLTKGEIDFALGVEQDALAIFRQGKKLEGREYVPPREMLDRLSGDKVRDTFQMLVHSPDVYGGTVDGLLYVDAGAYRDLEGDFIGRGFDLAKAAGDVFGAQGTGTTGTARGKIRFQGKAGNVLSLTGKGEGNIENARLVELPLFLGILSRLFGESSGRHYFNEVALRYTIADGKFKAPGDGVEIRSQGLKLIGGGTMDFSGALDLALEPRLIDLEIPIVHQIISFVKKGLAQVVIKGDLTRPEVQLVTGVFLKIGIDSPKPAEGQPALPSDLRDLPPGPK